jgi:hypothetical protein
MEVLWINRLRMEIATSPRVRRRRAIESLPGILQEHPTPSLAALRQLWSPLRPEELCESSAASPGPRPPNTVTVDELRRALGTWKSPGPTPPGASPPELPHALCRFLGQGSPPGLVGREIAQNGP